MIIYIIVAIVTAAICFGAYYAGVIAGEKKGKRILCECKVLIDKVLDITPPEKYAELKTIVAEFYDNIAKEDDND